MPLGSGLYIHLPEAFQKDVKFKSCLNCRVASRPAWATYTLSELYPLAPQKKSGVERGSKCKWNDSLDRCVHFPMLYIK